MSDRLCGYCRGLGHNASKCNKRLDQIEIIRRHVGSQRKLAQEILLANGVGPGAIVEGMDAWTGETVPCLVSSIQNYESLTEYQNIKYKKTVRSTLIFLGDEVPESSHDLVRYRKRAKISILAYTLADPSKSLTATFLLDKLQNPIVKLFPHTYRGWEYNKHSEVLSSTADTEVDMEDIMMPFQIHERLSLKKEGANIVTPIL